MTWDFAAELARHGPTIPWRGTPADARAYCAFVTRTHYENFSVASVLLPRHLRPHVEAVYAWCRWADDLADETPPGADALALLGWWRRELRACFAGEPTHPVTVALADTVNRFGIPPGPFERLIEAFEQDQRVRDYITFDQLLGYCERSANPVGHLVLYLFECHTPHRAQLSDETCTGLQLANFWQDVARDHAAGRVYLPAEDRARFGVDLADRQATPAFRDLLRFQVERTRGYFDRGDALLGLLPRPARGPVTLFSRGGRAVLRAIERQNCDVWARRPRVSKWAKAGLILRAVARA